MTKTLILGYITLLGCETIIIESIRKLVYSFLLTKRNIKGAKKIHLSQTRKDRFTLSYIEKYAVYKEDFRFYHRLLKVYTVSIFLQFIIIGIINWFSPPIAVWVLLSLGLLKLFFGSIFIRSHFSSSRISKYDRRYLLRKKRGK